jgi:hypothetical protein
VPALDLLELASELLVQSAEILDSAADPGNGVPGAPDRRIITVGTPALDCCDQLAVHVVTGYEERTGDQGRIAQGVACHGMTFVELRVQITGCVPSVDDRGNPPSADAINRSAVALYSHGWTMWCGLNNRAGSELFGEGMPKRAITVGPLTPVEEQGGCAGWFVQVAVQLDPDPDLGAAGS